MIGGAGDAVILSFGSGLGVQGPAAAVRNTELEIRAAAGERSPILFGQKRIDPTFGVKGRPEHLAGRQVLDVAADISSGAVHPDQLPIRVFEYGGGLVSADSRSLAAFSEAGLLPTNVTLIRPSRDLRLRLLEPALLPNSVLPATRIPITPSDPTILYTIELPK